MPADLPPADETPPSVPSRRPRPLLVPVLVVAGLTLLVYSPVLRHAFIEWDDRAAIQSNPRLNPPTAEGLAHYWTGMQPRKEFYAPVNYTAWWAVAHFARHFSHAENAMVLRPLPFHALNWLAHAAAAVAALLVLQRVVANAWAACAGALLFALHPLQAEPVSWASSMYSSLSGFFSLLAVWQYLRFSDLRRDGPRNAAWVAYALGTVCFAAAMLTKPTVVVVPLIAGIVDVLIRGRRMRDVVVPLGLWLALAAPVILLARASQRGAPVYVPSLPWRGLVALDSIAWYLWKLVVPIRLVPDYGRSPHWLLNDSAQALYTWIVPVALLALALATWRNARWPLACLLLFVSALLPTLGLVPFDYQRYSTVADRYAYLALLAPALALAWVLSRKVRPAYIASAIAATLALGAMATAQSLRWRDTDTLFAHTLTVNRHSLAAHSVMGYRHAQAGRLDEALAEYDRALVANPGDPLVLSLVGDAYTRQRRLPEAVEVYQRALGALPDNASLHLNLGVALAQLGRLDEAVPRLQRGVALDPRNAEAHANLATALFAQQEWAAARRHYEEALRLNPDSLTAQRGLARLEAEGH